MESEEKKNIHQVRSLCAKVLKDYLKLIKEARNCPFRWCSEKLTPEELESFSGVIHIPLDAMTSATERLEDLKPATWTVIDMKELGKRTITEIAETDRRYEQLSEARAEVIGLKREAAKVGIKQAHQQTMAGMKVAKNWLANGSSKQVFTILKSIGAHQAT